MKTLNKGIFAGLLMVLLLGSSVQAGELIVPNTFSDGSTAVAAEVNENFTATADAVNGNNSQIATILENIENIETTLGCVDARVDVYLSELFLENRIVTLCGGEAVAVISPSDSPDVFDVIIESLGISEVSIIRALGGASEVERYDNNKFSILLEGDEIIGVRKAKISPLIIPLVSQGAPDGGYRQLDHEPIDITMTVSSSASDTNLSDWWQNILSGSPALKPVTVKGLNLNDTVLSTYDFQNCIPTTFNSQPVLDSSGDYSFLNTINVRCFSLSSIEIDQAAIGDWYEDTMNGLTSNGIEVSIDYITLGEETFTSKSYSESYLTEYYFPQFDVTDSSQSVERIVFKSTEEIR